MGPCCEVSNTAATSAIKQTTRKPRGVLSN